MKCPMENGTKDLAWHFIATFVDHAAWLSVYIRMTICLHLCFWHRKWCLPLLIPRGQWRHKHKNYDTTGTVVRLMIPREQCWDSGGDTKYHGNSVETVVVTQRYFKWQWYITVWQQGIRGQQWYVTVTTKVYLDNKGIRGWQNTWEKGYQATKIWSEQSKRFAPTFTGKITFGQVMLIREAGNRFTVYNNTLKPRPYLAK
jgi:hypothetical protein